MRKRNKAAADYAHPENHTHNNDLLTMKHIIPLSLLALAPLAAHAQHAHSTACGCADVSKFVGDAGGSDASGRVALSETQRANLGLQTAVVAPARIARTVFALGAIVADPRGDSSAASRIAGRVVELKVALGDSVKKGDTLAVIESRQPGGPPALVPVAALADGTVTEVLTRLGEPASPDAALLRLSDRTRLVAEIRIPQNRAAELRAGVTRARLTPSGAPMRELTLHSLAPFADPVAGTVTARFILDNTDGALAPGRRAEARVILAESTLPVAAPREAVQGDKGDLFVFVESAPGVYAKRPVVVGEGDEHLVAILSGVAAGEKVATKGSFALRYADSSAPSLKAALDSAHGHAHGPNGEELSAGKAIASATGSAGGSPSAGHIHGPDCKHDAPAPATHAHGPECNHEAPAADADHDHEGESHDHDEAHDDDLDAPMADLDLDPLSGLESQGGEHVHGPDCNHAAAATAHVHGPDCNHSAEKTAATSFEIPSLKPESWIVFLATLAAGEGILLGLALTALRRRKDKEVSDA